MPPFGEVDKKHQSHGNGINIKHGRDGTVQITVLCGTAYMKPLRCFLYEGIQKSKGAGTLEGSRCFADALSVHTAENMYRTVLGEYGIKAGGSCLQKLLFIRSDAAAGRSLGRTAVFCNDGDPVLFDRNLYMINACIGGKLLFSGSVLRLQGRRNHPAQSRNGCERGQRLHGRKFLKCPFAYRKNR